MGYHFGKNFRPENGYPDNDGARLFIRRNRKKILIFLGIGVVLVITALTALAIFFFTVLLPAGTDTAKQAVPSGDIAGAVKSFINWIQQTLSKINVMQWITLLLQFNN